MRILIVDDSAFMRRVLRSYFTRERLGDLWPDGCIVSEAGTTQEALREIETEKPDIVLLDIVMDLSERDGIKILKAIKATAPRTHVLMLSAIGQEQVIQECMNCGASGYVLKPFEEHQMRAAIKSVLNATCEPQLS